MPDLKYRCQAILGFEDEGETVVICGAKAPRMIYDVHLCESHFLLDRYCNLQVSMTEIRA